jgi:hypothetical protein
MRDFAPLRGCLLHACSTLGNPLHAGTAKNNGEPGFS